MIADLNVHWDIGADGQPKPHAHVMLTMREVGEDGFGAKVRDWNRTELVEHMYDQDFDRDSNTIEVFVGRLRKKIGVDLIETVRGLGYRMQAPANGK